MFKMCYPLAKRTFNFIFFIINQYFTILGHDLPLGREIDIANYAGKTSFVKLNYRYAFVIQCQVCQFESPEL